MYIPEENSSVVIYCCLRIPSTRGGHTLGLLLIQTGEYGSTIVVIRKEEQGEQVAEGHGECVCVCVCVFFNVCVFM